MRQRKRTGILVLLFLFQIARTVLAGVIDEHDLSGIFWPAPPAEPRVFFVKNIPNSEADKIRKTPWARLHDLFWGQRAWVLSRPIDVAIDEDGRLYIADAGAGEVDVYDPQKNHLRRIKQIDKHNSLIAPVGVAISEETIFIADSVLKKIFAVDKKGKKRFILGEKEKLERPTGIFVRDKRLYVVDTDAAKIFVFDARGQELRRFGRKGKGDGEFNHPTHIYVDAQSKIYVSDTLNFRIQIFDPTGQFIKSIGNIGDSSGFFTRPKGVAVDSFGHIYVVDAMFDNIQIFDYTKNFLMSFGTTGTSSGEVWLPAGLAIDRNNFIYVADSYNQRISIFKYVGGE